MAAKPKMRKCPLCGAKITDQPLFAGRFEVMNKDYFVSKCRNCGFVHQNPVWPQNFYETLYNTVEYDPLKIAYPKELVKRFKITADIANSALLSEKNPKLLDYGCYDGAFTEWLKNSHAAGKKFKIFGYDIALKDAVISKVNYFNDLKKLIGHGPFDVVTLSHVLEHVYNPIELLKNIRENLLATNSRIIIELPDISFVRKNDFTPFHIQHLNYFTAETLAGALRRANLANLTVRTFQNFDERRDPLYPTVLIVGQKNPDYLPERADLVARIKNHKTALTEKIGSLKKHTKLAIMGCGDPLSQVISLIPQKIEVMDLYDNSARLWGKNLYGLKVKPPKKFAENVPDVIFTCTVNEGHSNAMVEQLKKMGFKGKIITVHE